MSTGCVNWCYSKSSICNTLSEVPRWPELSHWRWWRLTFVVSGIAVFSFDSRLWFSWKDLGRQSCLDTVQRLVKTSPTKKMPNDQTSEYVLNAWLSIDSSASHSNGRSPCENNEIHYQSIQCSQSNNATSILTYFPFLSIDIGFIQRSSETRITCFDNIIVAHQNIPSGQNTKEHFTRRQILTYSNQSSNWHLA